MMRKRTVFVLFPILAVATACTAILGVDDVPTPAPDHGQPGDLDGAVTNDNDARPSSDPLDVAINTYATANCQKSRECSHSLFEVFYQDVDECVASAKAGAELIRSMPGNGLTEALYQRCTANLANASCASLLNQDSSVACPVIGSRQNGEKCVLGAQCTSGICDTTPGSCLTCVAAPQAGAPCTQSGGCGPGLVCTLAGQCRQPATLNQQCSNSQPCAVGLVCVNAKCVAPPAAAGAICDPAGAGCDISQGFVCDGDSNQCFTFLVSGEGGSCGPVGTLDQPTLCRRGAQCSGTPGICPAPPAQGQPCGDAAGGALCLSPLLCLGGVCTPVPPASFCQ